MADVFAGYDDWLEKPWHELDRVYELHEMRVQARVDAMWETLGTSLLTAEDFDNNYMVISGLQAYILNLIANSRGDPHPVVKALENAINAQLEKFARSETK